MLRLAILVSACAAPLFAEELPREPSTVLFATDRAAFDAVGIETVHSTARAALRDGAGAVIVTGHADTLGDARYNRDLADRRARSVAEDLIARGVPRAAVSRTTLGETDLAVPTGDGVSEAANRRVVVTIDAVGANPPPDPDRPIRFPLP
jgi:outer membrane protein OmpA-like peptidoglycan-associated protein